MSRAPLVEDAGGVRRITFNRPDVLNALTLDDLAVVEGALRQLPGDVRAVVLAGAGGRAFSAGMHVDTFVDASPSDGADIIGAVARAVGAVRLARVATVAVIDGHCLGAAFEMALSCDVRVCSTRATVGLPEVRLGIPSVVEAALLVQHVGIGKAKEMILTGAVYPIDTVPTLANVLVDPAELPAAVDGMLHSLTAPTAAVIAAQKSLFDTWLDTGLTEGIEISQRVFAEVFALPVTQEAIASYRSRS
jgi:enoyl-CoA hydratase/carnithine racemase